MKMNRKGTTKENAVANFLMAGVNLLFTPNDWKED
jgi:hypothetical protein